MNNDERDIVIESLADGGPAAGHGAVRDERLYHEGDVSSKGRPHERPIG